MNKITSFLIERSLVTLSLNDSTHSSFHIPTNPHILKKRIPLTLSFYENMNTIFHKTKTYHNRNKLTSRNSCVFTERSVVTRSLNTNANAIFHKPTKPTIGIISPHSSYKGVYQSSHSMNDDKKSTFHKPTSLTIGVVSPHS